MRALLIFGLIASPAVAAPPMPRWTPIKADGRRVEVDRASLSWRPMQRAWWRVLHAEPRRDGTREERHLELIDCRTLDTAVIQIVSLDGNGRVLNDQQDGEPLAEQRLGPPTSGTVGEAVAEAACRMRPPPPRPKRK